MSNRTIVYKGLMVAHQLPEFYLDLREPAYETALCVFHQRYSTNTLPNWILAQPFRVLSHNGEINTLQGNRNWTRAREAELESSVWGDEVSEPCSAHPGRTAAIRPVSTTLVEAIVLLRAAMSATQ